MAYGTIKVDTITFTDAGVDKSVTISGLVQNPTFSGNITVTGTVSGNTIQGQTVSGATVTGDVASFTTVTGGVATITSGVFALGTNALPSLTFTGDLNTGIYSPGADQVAISTSGTGQLFVDASGNVILGTTSVLGGAGGRVLQIGNTSDASSTLQFAATTAGSSQIQFGDGGSPGSYAGYLQYTHTDNVFAIGTASNERLRITSTGTVNIVGAGSAGSTQAVSFNGSAPVDSLVLTSGGLVGIGTSSPNYQLHVTTDFAVGASGFNQQLTFSNDTIQSLLLGTGYTALKLNPLGGNVGIGTSTVNTTLEVLNSSTPIIRVGDGTRHMELRGGSTTQNAAIGTNYSGGFDIIQNGSAAVTIDTSKRLLVGTSSTSVTYTTALLQGSAGDTAAQSILRLARGSSTPSSGAALGVIAFSNSAHSDGANIYAARDGGTWSASSLPTALVFSTTSDGASSPTERVLISSTGALLCGRDFRDATHDTNDQFVIQGNGFSARHGLNATAYTIGQNSNARVLRIGSGSGWSTTGVSLAAGGTSWGTYSDQRLKTDIVELTDCLDNIKDIRCVSYRLKNVDETDSKKRLGIIAQDIVGKYDEALSTSRRSDADETEYLSVQYTDLVPVLIKALQEATERIETLEAKVAALESA